MPASLKLLLTGDVMHGRLVNERLHERPQTFPSGMQTPYVAQCVITRTGVPTSIHS